MNKQTGEKCMLTAKEYEKRLGLNNFIKPLGRTDEYILGEVSQYYLLNRKQTNDKLIKIVKGMSDDSNPVICLMNVKQK